MRSVVPVALAVVLTVVVMTGLWLLLALREPPPLAPATPSAVTLLPEPRPLPPFELIDHNGKPFGPPRLSGDWTFLFFGYTHCPDFCPSTLASLKAVRERLGETAARFVFVSLDPRRDTPQALKAFVRYFHTDFIGATADHAALEHLARELGVVYSIDGDPRSDSYRVNHTASVLLLDPLGRWYGRFTPPHTPESLLAGYQTARESYLK